LYAMDFNDDLDTSKIPTTFSAVTEDEYERFEEEVRIYAMYLIRGTLEHLEEVDRLISRFSLNRPLERIDYVDRNILRISVFSFLYANVHPHVIIDEAVKLSQEFSSEVNYKFINGILDAMNKQVFQKREGVEYDPTEE
ncbi:MAG: transcription antitermination factor NusB, partial [Spirochaetales bacterium]|nr:transcription antitermination factor NusB [Spirochaetales bacterium]